MNLKTYRAASIADALAQIKKDLGADAVILHTRQYKHGGWLGVGGRKMVEITASTGVNVPAPAVRKGRAGGDPAVRPAPDLLRRVYGTRTPPTAGAGAAGVAVAEPPPAPTAPEPPVAAAARDVARLVTPPGAGGGGCATVAQGALAEEIAAIKRLVGQVLHASKGRCEPAMPEALMQRYLRLIEAEVAGELADEIVGAVRDELNADELADETIVHQAVLRRLAAYISVCVDAPKAGKAPDGRPVTIALVGPTGVGKTTTIAKLAATYKLRHGRGVGLVTCDTYRIAAVDQLRTYANIIGLPLKVALTPNEMASSCAALADCDVVLIDTAGRSQHDASRLDDLSAFLQAARPHETHLVLSGAASQSVLERTASCFSVVRPNRVIFTKLDEAVNFGVLVNAAKSIGARLSFVTTGQEVPDHIEPGRADRLARLVLEGGAVR